MTRRSVALVAIVASAITVLLYLRVTGSGGILEITAQVVLLAAFAALAVVDLRAATAIVLLELALGGASGRWTLLGGVVSGRLAMDAVVFAVAVWRLLVAWREGQRPRLGRYGAHAVAVGVLLPAIWIPIGLLSGSRPVDAWDDGNGYAFFAFSVVLAALAATSDLRWLRGWLLIACSAVAALTTALAIAAVFVLPDLNALRDVLLVTLDQGGVIGLTDDYLRLALGSGLYLVVGLALVAWAVMDNPRRVWPWLLVALFSVALLATYTRALWIAAAFVVLLIGVLGASRLRGLALAGGIAATAFVVAGAFSLAAGWAYPAYLYERVSTAVALPDGEGNPYELDFGVVSNAIKIHQAQVLTAHFIERPIAGWGFGAIAPDYRYSASYSYELSYIALAFKTGILGVALFFSLPLRLILDALRVRFGRLAGVAGLSRYEAAVPLAILAALLGIGATNPWLVASFGLAPIVWMLAWLDPFGVRPRATDQADRRSTAPLRAASSGTT